MDFVFPSCNPREGACSGSIYAAAMTSPLSKIAALCTVALVLQSTGLLLFVLGFFPVKSALNGVSGTRSFAPGCDVEEESEELNPRLNNGRDRRADEDGIVVLPQYDRVVFMVIDGLPAEFVLGKDGSTDQPIEMMGSMPYTQKLLSTGAALGYHAKAASPTVTMPRLKAMTSGAIAGFLDVAYNFNTQALLEDNWLGQLGRAGWRMVMLGDNTWLKLFPNLFERHDGVHSFFVKDTVEVDRNVTRHLDVELVSNDWDLLVLHYLGLDHVGHLGGRKSPLMASKLKEMDDVISRIHQKVLAESCPVRKTLLVVVSDHGMTDSGNHGGSTTQETDALALFVTGFGCNSPAGPMFRAVEGLKTGAAYQVDLVPTIALLLGVPIPKNSVGTLLSPLFASLKPEQQLKALELNSWQLLRLVRAQSPPSSCVNELCQFQRAGKSEELMPMSATGGKVQSFCSLFRSALDLQRKWSQRGERTLMSYEVEIPTFEMVQEAYLRFLKPTSEWLARSSTEKHINLLLIGTSMMLISLLLLLVGLHKTCKFIWVESARPSGQLIRQTTPLFIQLVAIGGVCAHAASLGSSSFVEEEQYTWHFLLSTLFLAFLRLSLQQWGSWIKQDLSMEASDRGPNSSVGRVLQICVLLLLGRTLRSWHRSGVNWTHLPDVAKYLENGNPAIASLIQIICVCSVTLLCCKMVSKSLTKLLQSVIVAGLTLSAGLIFMYMWFTKTATQDTVWATLSARLVYCVLGGTSAVAFFFIPWTLPLSPQSTTARPSLGMPFAIEGVYLSTLEMAVEGAMNATGQVLVSCWCLLQLLLQQPVNAGPILLILLQLGLALRFLQKLGPSYQQWVPILTMHWLGISGHFGLGNSNSLATVDVAGAYIGLSSHSTVLSGILAFCITYGSPLLYMQALLLLKSSKSEALEQLSQLWLVESFALRVVLPMALNSVVLIVFTWVLLIMQDHLFVWSVFSPKYLYVCMTSVALYIGTLMVLLVGAYSSFVLSKRMHWTNAFGKGSKRD